MSEPSNPWKTLSSRLVYENPWIRVREDQVLRPDGQPGIYGVVEFKNRAVGVLPVEDDGSVWLVGQYRYPLSLYSWEIPEGGSPASESTEETALRELREETGLTAGRLELISTLAPFQLGVRRDCLYLPRHGADARREHARRNRRAARQARVLGRGVGNAPTGRDHRLDVRHCSLARGGPKAGRMLKSIEDHQKPASVRVGDGDSGCGSKGVACR